MRLTPEAAALIRQAQHEVGGSAVAQRDWLAQRLATVETRLVSAGYARARLPQGPVGEALPDVTPTDLGAKR